MAGMVTVRGVCLGMGRPKICVPLVGDMQAALLAEAEAALAAGAELVEWRADFMAQALNTPVEDAADRLCETAKALREALGDTPLLFTLRGKHDGGQCPFRGADTALLLQEAAKTGAVDLLDIELALGKALCEQTVAAAEENNVKTILSHHRFTETPPVVHMVDTLRDCERLGADIAKLAVMPVAPTDVLALLAATDIFRREGGIPAITMSMGALGAVSRLCGEVFGSCVTFGAGQNASAPGQIEAKALAGMLEALGQENGKKG